MGRIQKKSQEFRIRIEFLIHEELLRIWKSVLLWNRADLPDQPAGGQRRPRQVSQGSWLTTRTPRCSRKNAVFKLKFWIAHQKPQNNYHNFLQQSRSRLPCSCKFKKIFTSIYGSSQSRNRQIVELQKCDAQYWLQHVSSPVAKRRRRRQ